jgi:hypothetical protein
VGVGQSEKGRLKYLRRPPLVDPIHTDSGNYEVSIKKYLLYTCFSELLLLKPEINFKEGDSGTDGKYTRTMSQIGGYLN